MRGDGACVLLALLGLACGRVTPPADAAEAEVADVKTVIAEPDPVEACMESASGDVAAAAGLVRALCIEVVATKTPGASLAIASAAGEEVSISVGVRCAAGSSPVLPRTAFRIGSVTKSLVASAVVTRAKAEGWSLDEPVADHVPGIASSYSGVTWRHLLDHTAGFSETPAKLEHIAMTPAELAAELSKPPPLFPPGTRHVYANAGYVVLGMALSHRTQTPVVELVREVLGPGADRSQVPIDAREHDLGETACGHVFGIPVTVHEDLDLLAKGATWTFAAGGVVMPAPSLARAGVQLATDLRTEASVPTETAPWRYALGMRRRVLAQGDEHWLHAGMTGDFAAELHILPEVGKAVVVLANGGSYLRATAFAALAHAAPGVDFAAP